MQCMSPDPTGPYLHRRHRYHHRYKYSVQLPLYKYSVQVQYVRTSKQTRTMEGAMSRISGSKPVIGRALRTGVVRIQSWKTPLSAIVPSTKPQPCIYETYAIVQLKKKKRKKNSDASTRAWSIHSFIQVVFNQSPLPSKYLVHVHTWNEQGVTPNTVLIYLSIREYGVLQTIPCIEQVLLLLLRSVI